ncbi:GTPase HflX [Streptomyces microflavus]
MLDAVYQRRDKPDPATYIGSGKALQLRDIVLESGADTVVCDGELSPGQLIHLEDVVKVKWSTGRSRLSTRPGRRTRRPCSTPKPTVAPPEGDRCPSDGRVLRRAT